MYNKISVFDAVDSIRVRQKSRMDASARVAYGIAKNMGIDTSGMSPKEVWEAIAKKGGTSKAVAERGKKLVKITGAKTIPKRSDPEWKSVLDKTEREKKSKKFLGHQECSIAKTVGGYTRKNKFVNGYGFTEVDPGWSTAGPSGRTVRDNTDDSLCYSEEREAIHSKCIDDAFDGVKKPSGTPRCVFMGGGSGSGKSTVANMMPEQFGLFADDERVKCDSDACKKYLPGYTDKKPRPFHNESSDMAARIRKIALENGYNVLVDGTGDGGVEWMRQQIEDARAQGHKVDGRYVFMPLESAKELNRNRSRSVDEETLVRLHSNVAKVIPEIASDFDDFKLFANILNGEPKLIATCKRGEEIQVVDKDLWEQVLDVANYYNKK